MLNEKELDNVSFSPDTPQIVKNQKSEKPTNVRWALLGFVFFACLVAYFDRTNLSVTGPKIMADYGFTKVQYGLTWSAFLLAYSIGQIPGGYLSNKLGIRKTGLVALLMWSLFTILTPVAAGFATFCLVRFLFGLGEAPLFPNNGNFLKNYFNKTEKATSSGIMLCGAFIAPAFATPISVWIMEQWGWQSVFYIYGTIGIAMALLWYFAFREHPQEHPWMNEAEVEIIGKSEPAPAAPLSLWKRFLSSTQFWGHGVQYGFVCYILYVFMSWLPMYLLETRHMTWTKMGMMAALPYVALCIGMLIAGRASDAMVKHGYTKFLSRTTFMMLGMIMCGFGLYMGANAVTMAGTVAWMTASLGFLGLNFTVSWTINQDLGNKQSVQVTSWMNMWANLGGLAAPPMTAWLVVNFGWVAALNITAIMVAAGSLLCLFIRPDHPLHD